METSAVTLKLSIRNPLWRTLEAASIGQRLEVFGFLAHGLSTVGRLIALRIREQAQRRATPEPQRTSGDDPALAGRGPGSGHARPTISMYTNSKAIRLGEKMRTTMTRCWLDDGARPGPESRSVCNIMQGWSE